MESGKTVYREQIKADAIPLGTVVDGVVKEVWADDDYETVEEWVEYTPEEYAEGRISELKQLLADTDYIAAKIAEGASTREEYADVIAQRQQWRDEINALR